MSARLEKVLTSEKYIFPRRQQNLLVEFQNLWFCGVNEEILKNEINICSAERFKYAPMRWPKKEFVLVLFQFPTRSFITSCYLPKCIILTVILFFIHGVAVLPHLPDGRRGNVLLQCQTWQHVSAMPDVAHGVAALPRLPRHWVALLCLHITYRITEWYIIY